MLLLNTTPKKCERCGKEYSRTTVQDMPRYCVRCGKEVHYCDECVRYGCPDCGGELVDIWTYYEKVKGMKIMF